MDRRSPELRWGVERRLEFIEFRLFWDGAINRADLTDFFGVSVPQASKDLSQYQGRAPGNMKYDKSQKRYLASANFSPIFFKPDADQYLAQLKSIADNIASPRDTWLSNAPSLDSMPVPHRRVDIDVLRAILNAIKKQRGIEILYQSMSSKRPNPTWRWISPHALASDGFRWHIRAFCHIENRFKDFLLSRTLEVHNDGEQGSPATADRFWNEYLDVVLVPNPQLSKSQQEIIAIDFNMDNGKLTLPMRKAILYYFKRRLRLDVAEALDRPQEAPVIVANRDDFEAALKEASSQKKELIASL